MCDYSLMHMPNRLAVEGETLITHRFSSGSIGLVSPEELGKAQMAPPLPRPGLWRRFITSFTFESSGCSAPAVCIPPGASLRLEYAPARTRQNLELPVGEKAVFTQITLALNQFRDAIRLESGREVLLQTVGQGLEVTVLSLDLAQRATEPPSSIHASAKGL